METLQKHLWLLDQLQHGQKKTFEELDSAWQEYSGKALSRSSFNRWKDALEESFGVLIECDLHDGYRWRLAEATHLTTHDVRHWIVNSYAQNRALEEGIKIHRQIVLDEIPSGQQWLEPCMGALRAERQATITYQGFNSSSPVTFTVEPWALRLSQGRWYLLARSVDFSTPRVYALDRMRGVELTATPGRPPKDFDAEAFFGEYCGVIVDEKVELTTVTLLVSGNQRNYLRTLPLHSSQTEETLPDKPDVSRFKLRIRPTYDLMMNILRQGPEVEVESPSWFRQQTAETAKAIAARYCAE